MTQSNPLIIPLIKIFEGLGDGDKKKPGLQVYFDIVGIATLGYGHVLVDRKTGQRISVENFGHAAAQKAQAWMLETYNSDTITEQQATDLLIADTASRVAGVKALLVGVPTTENEEAALVSFSFNAGVKGLASSTLLRLHKGNRKARSPLGLSTQITVSKLAETRNTTEAFAAWSKSGGQWIRGLFRRRLIEAEVYFGSDITKAITTIDGRFKSGI